MPSVERPSVIVLAGGNSSRFGRDKLVARIDGLTSIARVVRRVREVGASVTIVTSSRERARTLERRLPGPIRWCVDADDVYGPGPGGAIARGLAAVPSRPAIVVPGDIPWIQTTALRRFVTAATNADVDVATPAWGDGGTENLIQWHLDPGNVTAVREAIRGPNGSLRASVFLRALPRTLIVPIRTLTRTARTFAHVTTAADLRTPAPRGDVRGRTALYRVVGAPKQWYRAATSARVRDDLPAAARAFDREAAWYARAGLPRLAAHAAEDARAMVNRTTRLPKSS